MDQRPRDDSAALEPTRGVALIRRVASPLWLRIGMAAVLEVPGRRTGTPRRATIIPVDIDGTTYLMGFTGITGWVQNLRAAGRADLRRKGRAVPFNGIEVEGDERDRVIAAYLARLPGFIKKDFERRPGAADHPVFKVEPIA
jgi:deazaflavin-dependent oxidoreductase (nitroreductase family)